MLQKITVTSNYPNQLINFTANGQNITLELFWRGFINLPTDEQDYIDTYEPPSFYANIYLNNVLLVTGANVIDRTAINLYPSDLNGYIMSVDSTGNNNPDLENLGITVFIYYMDNLNELTELVV